MSTEHEMCEVLEIPVYYMVVVQYAESAPQLVKGIYLTQAEAEAAIAKLPPGDYLKTVVESTKFELPQKDYDAYFAEKQEIAKYHALCDEKEAELQINEKQKAMNDASAALKEKIREFNAKTLEGYDPSNESFDEFIKEASELRAKTRNEFLDALCDEKLSYYEHMVHYTPVADKIEHELTMQLNSDAFICETCEHPKTIDYPICGCSCSS